MSENQRLYWSNSVTTFLKTLLLVPFISKQTKYKLTIKNEVYDHKVSFIVVVFFFSFGTRLAQRLVKFGTMFIVSKMFYITPSISRYQNT